MDSFVVVRRRCRCCCIAIWHNFICNIRIRTFVSHDRDERILRFGRINGMWFMYTMQQTQQQQHQQQQCSGKRQPNTNRNAINLVSMTKSLAYDFGFSFCYCTVLGECGCAVLFCFCMPRHLFVCFCSALTTLFGCFKIPTPLPNNKRRIGRFQNLSSRVCMGIVCHLPANKRNWDCYIGAWL